jgi:glutaredoxin
MADPWVRALLGLGAAAVAVGVGYGARIAVRRRVETRPIDLTGTTGGVVFFSDAACVRCDDARAALDATGVAYEEIAYDREPSRLEAAGVIAVPLIVVRRADGTEVGRIAGRVRPWRLRRLIARSGH